MTLNEYQRQFILSHLSTLRMRVTEAETKTKEAQEADNARLEYFYIGRKQVFDSELQVWEFLVDMVLTEDLIQPEDCNANAA
jgi:hypothetical protein